jgi:aerobic-type carbon monoxide dehydrogenase small subunit (CoxS/CutS family)
LSEEKEKLSEEKKPEKKGVSRRGFIQGAVAGLVVGAAATYGATTMMQPPTATPKPTVPMEVVGPVDGKVISMTINGETITKYVSARWTLQKYLREVVGLVGTPEACDNGVCGNCTVLMNGNTVLSCCMLAMDAADANITTIEGLGTPENLSSIQQSFIKNSAFQCGGCTPAFILAGKALKDKKSSPSEDEIREAVSGIICRCGTYERVVKAIMEA